MRRWVFLAALLVLTPAGMAFAEGANPLSLLFGHHKGVAPVTDELYAEECGACHYAYPPGLLPRRSWEKVMQPEALEDHFGDDASLDEETRARLAAYLDRNAADDSWYKRSIKIRRSIPKDEAPLRITEVAYIKRRHADIPESDIQGNNRVRSLSQCDACHRKAEKGTFDDDTVQIPKPRPENPS